MSWGLIFVVIVGLAAVWVVALRRKVDNASLAIQAKKVLPIHLFTADGKFAFTKGWNFQPVETVPPEYLVDIFAANGVMYADRQRRRRIDLFQRRPFSEREFMVPDKNGLVEARSVENRPGVTPHSKWLTLHGATKSIADAASFVLYVRSGACPPCGAEPSTHLFTANGKKVFNRKGKLSWVSSTSRSDYANVFPIGGLLYADAQGKKGLCPGTNIGCSSTSAPSAILTVPDKNGHIYFHHTYKGRGYNGAYFADSPSMFMNDPAFVGPRFKLGASAHECSLPKCA